jgi:hypothetical protein
MGVFGDFGPIVTFEFRTSLLQAAYDRLMRVELDPTKVEDVGLLALIDELRGALGTVEIAELNEKWRQS